jgi:hypothetical protein
LGKLSELQRKNSRIKVVLSVNGLEDDLSSVPGNIRLVNSGYAYSDVLNKFLGDQLATSIYVQARQALAGLEDAPMNSLVVRLRTDFDIQSPDVFEFAMTTLADGLDDHQPLRLLTLGTRNHLALPVPFHFSDFVQIGSLSNVKHYWSGALRYQSLTHEIEFKPMWSSTFTPNVLRNWTPEQFSIQSYLGLDSSLDSHASPKLPSFYASVKTLGRKITLISPEHIGVKLPLGLLDPGTMFWRAQEKGTSAYKPVTVALISFASWVHARILFFLNPFWWGMRPWGEVIKRSKSPH